MKKRILVPSRYHDYVVDLQDQEQLQQGAGADFRDALRGAVVAGNVNENGPNMVVRQCAETANAIAQGLFNARTYSKMETSNGENFTHMNDSHDTVSSNRNFDGTSRTYNKLNPDLSSTVDGIDNDFKKPNGKPGKGRKTMGVGSCMGIKKMGRGRGGGRGRGSRGGSSSKGLVWHTYNVADENIVSLAGGVSKFGKKLSTGVPRLVKKTELETFSASTSLLKPVARRMPPLNPISHLNKVNDETGNDVEMPPLFRVNPKDFEERLRNEVGVSDPQQQEPEGMETSEGTAFPEFEEQDSNKEFGSGSCDSGICSDSSTGGEMDASDPTATTPSPHVMSTEDGYFVVDEEPGGPCPEAGEEEGFFSMETVNWVMDEWNPGPLDAMEREISAQFDAAIHSIKFGNEDEDVGSDDFVFVMRGSHETGLESV